MLCNLMMLTCLCATGATLEAQDELRVLFIGNSLTFGGPQWELLEKFAAADPAGPQVTTGYHVKAATPLSKLWTSGGGKSQYQTAQQAIAAARWTHVVLQPYGGDLRRDNHPMLHRYIAAIKAVGAQPVLYCTTPGVMETIDVKATECLESASAPRSTSRTTPRRPTSAACSSCATAATCAASTCGRAEAPPQLIGAMVGSVAPKAVPGSPAGISPARMRRPSSVRVA